jgi:hypothetical protein
MTDIYVLTQSDFKDGRAQPLYYTVDAAIPWTRRRWRRGYIGKQLPGR